MGSTRKDGKRRTSRPRRAGLMKEKPCRQCEKPFRPNHTATLYCSDECRDNFKSGQKSSIKNRFVIPELVTDNFPVEDAGHTKAYIDNRARKNDRKRRKRAEALAVPVTCKREGCGKEFVRDYTQQKYCTTECQPLIRERIAKKVATADKKNRIPVVDLAVRTRHLLASSEIFQKLTVELDIIKLANVGPIDMSDWPTEIHESVRVWCNSTDFSQPPPVQIQEYLDLI